MKDDLEKISAMRVALRDAGALASAEHYMAACLLEAARAARLLSAAPTEAAFMENARDAWRHDLGT